MERADLLRAQALLVAVRDLLAEVQRLLELAAPHAPAGSPSDDLVEDMYISVRAANALRAAGCKTKADVRRMGEQAIARMPNCGRVTLREIGDAIGGWPKSWEQDKPT